MGHEIIVNHSNFEDFGPAGGCDQVVKIVYCIGLFPASR
jgi:hypothetical protein